jgi:hypothetical protein
LRLLLGCKFLALNPDNISVRGTNIVSQETVTLPKPVPLNIKSFYGQGQIQQASILSAFKTSLTEFMKKTGLTNPNCIVFDIPEGTNGKNNA